MSDKEIKICFNDLSLPLKWLVVMSWITSVYFVIIFAIGFLMGMLGLV